VARVEDDGRRERTLPTLATVTEAGLRTRRGLVLSPQSVGHMVQNSICIGRVESADYGVSARDFEPLVDALKLAF
jgi:hypothetical protein